MFSHIIYSYKAFFRIKMWFSILIIRLAAFNNKCHKKNLTTLNPKFPNFVIHIVINYYAKSNFIFQLEKS